jgi:hypothetical protein
VGPRRAIAAACLLSLLLVSCVERELIVKTDPVDASIEVDGLDLGRGSAERPVSLRFDHYGIRRVVARAPGRIPADELVTLDPPWWQVFPIDLVTDVLLPFTIRDERTLRIRLGRKAQPTREDALEAERRARAAAAEAAERRPP